MEQLSLAHLDYGVPLVVQADASTMGVGGCLINRYPDGDRVIGCYSHAFSTTESRWKTIEQECCLARAALPGGPVGALLSH